MNEPRPAAENKMGTMPVPKLLFTMSIPMVISMLVQALYNVVDSVFVAKLSEDALNAVSLAFPVQNLMISVAVAPAWASTRCSPKVWAKNGRNVPTPLP